MRFANLKASSTTPVFLKHGSVAWFQHFSEARAEEGTQGYPGYQEQTGLGFSVVYPLVNKQWNITIFDG